MGVSRTELNSSDASRGLIFLVLFSFLPRGRGAWCGHESRSTVYGLPEALSVSTFLPEILLSRPSGMLSLPSTGLALQDSCFRQSFCEQAKHQSSLEVTMSLVLDPGQEAWIFLVCTCLAWLCRSFSVCVRVRRSPEAGAGHVTAPLPQP